MQSSLRRLTNFARSFYKSKFLSVTHCGDSQGNSHVLNCQEFKSLSVHSSTWDRTALRSHMYQCINVSCTLVAKSSVFESRVHLDTCGKITLHSRWGLGPWESLDESLPMWRLSSEWSDAVLFVQFCGIQVALCILYVHVEKWISWYLHVCI